MPMLSDPNTQAAYEALDQAFNNLQHAFAIEMTNFRAAIDKLAGMEKAPSPPINQPAEAPQPTPSGLPGDPTSAQQAAQQANPAFADPGGKVSSPPPNMPQQAEPHPHDHAHDHAHQEQQRQHAAQHERQHHGDDHSTGINTKNMPHKPT